ERVAERRIGRTVGIEELLAPSGVKLARGVKQLFEPLEIRRFVFHWATRRDRPPVSLDRTQHRQADRWNAGPQVFSAATRQKLYHNGSSSAAILASMRVDAEGADRVVVHKLPASMSRVIRYS